MPQYVAGIATTIYGGEAETVWSAETPTAGTGAASASKSYVLNQGPHEQPGYVVQGQFSGAPGAFEIDVQGSELADADADYTNIAQITAVDANQNFRYDGAQNPTFIRLLMKTRTNSVNVTAQVKKN